MSNVYHTRYHRYCRNVFDVIEIVVSIIGNDSWLEKPCNLVTGLCNVNFKELIYSEIYANTKLNRRIDDGPLRNLKLV